MTFEEIVMVIIYDIRKTCFRRFIEYLIWYDLGSV